MFTKSNMELEMIDNPNAKSIRRSIEIDNNGNWTSIVEIVTDLELDAMSPQYSEQAVDSLIEAIGSWGANNQSAWDVLRIVREI